MDISATFFSFLVLLAFFELLRQLSRRFRFPWFKSPLGEENWFSMTKRFAVLFKEAYMKSYWEKLGFLTSKNKKLRIAVWGAGEHTAWLHKLVTDAEIDGPEVTVVVDATAVDGAIFWGRKVIRPEKVDLTGIDAVFISSDKFTEEMKKECRNYVKEQTKILFPYEGLIQGSGDHVEKYRIPVNA